uniref:Uncharacterized protein n=1 Tax=Arundo donax TaxID=35708 RepID=A0A0A9AA05_ARUDO
MELWKRQACIIQISTCRLFLRLTEIKAMGKNGMLHQENQHQYLHRTHICPQTQQHCNTIYALA